MSYSAYFAARSEHYRKLAIAEPNGWRAEYRLGLANLFLQMSGDMRVREHRQVIAAALADEKAVTAKPHAMPGRGRSALPTRLAQRSARGTSIGTEQSRNRLGFGCNNLRPLGSAPTRLCFGASICCRGACNSSYYRILQF